MTSSSEWVSATSSETPAQFTLLDSDGNARVGPVQRDGDPFLAGADGTIYTAFTNLGRPSRNEVIAFGPDMSELWRFDMNGGPPYGNGVLDTDGVLYLARTSTTGVLELLAIQTRSPGLAESSWPSVRGDNRGTSWLRPWAPSGAGP